MHKIGLMAAFFSFAFLLTFLISSELSPTFDSSAANISVVNTARGYYADITSSGSIGLDVIADANGKTEILADSLTVDTNARNGYKLFIATSGNNNALYPSGDTTEDSSISALSTTTAGALSTNSWGYVPARETSSGTAVEPTSDSATFKGVPTSGNDTILYTNTAPAETGTNSLSVYYGTKVDTKMPSGDYTLSTDTSGASPVTDTVVYTAVVDAVNSDAVEASVNPSWQEGLAGGGTVTIATGLYPGFSMSDMGNIEVYIGDNECTNPTPSLSEINSLNITCTAPAQNAVGKYDVTVEVERYDKTYTLEDGYEYKISPKTIANSTYMQEVESCPDTLTTGTQYTLTDSRDQKQYTVSKLADGKCWMTANLNIGSESNPLTPDTSNVSSNYNLPSSSTSGFSDDSTAYVYNSTDVDGSNRPYGGYYSYKAATAGTSPSSGNATSDICPKNWRLPTETELYTLISSYSASSDGSKLTASPVNMLYGGYYNNSSLGFRGEFGRYWSSSANDSSYAYGLDFAPSWAMKLDYRKSYGYSVRCLSNPSS